MAAPREPASHRSDCGDGRAARILIHKGFVVERAILPSGQCQQHLLRMLARGAVQLPTAPAQDFLGAGSRKVHRQRSLINLRIRLIGFGIVGRVQQRRAFG